MVASVVAASMGVLSAILLGLLGLVWRGQDKRITTIEDNQQTLSKAVAAQTTAIWRLIDVVNGLCQRLGEPTHSIRPDGAA